MPETPIDENRQPLGAENEVRPSKDGLVPPPTGDSLTAKDAH
jgi:hypothetical protein